MRRTVTVLLFLLLMNWSCSKAGTDNCGSGASQAGHGNSQDYIEMFDSKTTLSTCSMYRISSFSPEYDGVLHEGNIAYYGLIAQAMKDRKLAEKVADVSTKSYLWEYGYGYGATSADSAIVLEALIELGVRKDKVEKSLDSMIVKYYDEQKGCFKTVEGAGRAKYWKGCSAGVTAHIAVLLKKFNADKYADIIEKSAEFVAGKRTRGGVWSSRWFPSFTIPTYYSIRLLKSFNGKYDEIIKKAAGSIAEKINDEGNWNGSVIETSAAILALKQAEGNDKTVSEAEKWLKNNKNSGPEPVLFYWFEKRGHKMFFSCYDNGDISLAWRKLALDE